MHFDQGDVKITYILSYPGPSSHLLTPSDPIPPATGQVPSQHPAFVQCP